MKIAIKREVEWYDDLLTERCIVCSEKAIVWSGHVTLDEGTVSAGFCSKQCNDHLKPNKGGSFGEWKVSNGLHYYDLRNEA